MFLKRSDLLLESLTLLSSIRLTKYAPVDTPTKPDEPGAYITESPVKSMIW